MAISDSQKVDLLWKKIGFGKTKTDTNAQKKAPNEAVVSEFIIKPDQIWTNANNIPSVIPTANSSIVAVYSDSLSSSVETTEDATSSAHRTWKTNLTNWIPPSFGATYQLKVYSTTTGQSNPQSVGDQLFETGSGNDDQWYFDYQSGVLHFIGDNLPTAIGTGTSNVIYVVGARYTGPLGIDAESTGASVTYRKVNLAAVYSDANINDGDLIEVTDAGDGEVGVFIAKQDNPTQASHLTQIASRDSGAADSQTLSATFTFDSGNVTLGDVSATSRPLSVVVNVTDAFDGNTSISIGDDQDPERLMDNNYVDLGEQMVFEVSPSYVYANALDADNTIKLYVTRGTSTEGNATVLVSYT